MFVFSNQQKQKINNSNNNNSNKIGQVNNINIKNRNKDWCDPSQTERELERWKIKPERTTVEATIHCFISDAASKQTHWRENIHSIFKESHFGGTELNLDLC